MGRRQGCPIFGPQSTNAKKPSSDITPTNDLEELERLLKRCLESAPSMFSASMGINNCWCLFFPRSQVNLAMWAEQKYGFCCQAGRNDNDGFILKCGTEKGKTILKNRSQLYQKRELDAAI